MEKMPFIHLFTTSLGYYIYDVNTDEILKVPKFVYQYLEGKKLVEDELDKAQKYITGLVEQGYLKTKRVIETEHPETKLISDYLDNKISFLILQVTQNCNLRCKYCVYSGGYQNRTHTNKRMTFEMAKKGIDFLMEHSKDSDRLFLGFYGGEPLLEMKLLERCVSYALSVCEGKEIFFSFTTNAVLLTLDKMDFFVKHKFNILISLDGPREVHDIHRKMAGTNKGSFDTVFTNIKAIQEKYPAYYEQNIGFNTVLDPERGFEKIRDFFNNEPIFTGIRHSASLIEEKYSFNRIGMSDNYMEEMSYELFLLCLQKLHRINKSKSDSLVEGHFTNLDRFIKDSKSAGRKELPDKWHHGGPCIPGVRRLFMTCDGDFYPCEHVSEQSKLSKIGSISEGIDPSKVERLLNIERESRQKCHNCWAYSHCTACICGMDDCDEISGELLAENCRAVRWRLEETMKDWVVLDELGYGTEGLNF